MSRLFVRNWQRVVLGLALVAMPVSALAAGTNAAHPGKYVYVSKDQVIEGNFYTAGDTVDINGTVNGDIIVAGGNINITGAVSGDVIAVGGRVHVSGPVQGDLRVAGGDISVDSVIGKNATVAGGNVTFSKSSAVGWEAMVFAGMLNMQGRVVKDLRGAVGQATINNEIGRDVWLKIGGDGALVLQPDAKINGNLSYMSPAPAQVFSGATIQGEMKYQPFARPVSDQYRHRAAIFAYLAFKLLCILALWVVGWILIWLAPKAVERSERLIEKQMGPALGWGALLIFAMPAVGMLFAITLVGLPVAMLLAAAYVCYLILGYVVAGAYLGERLLRKMSKRPWHVSLHWAMMLGVAVLVILTMIPFLGALIKLAAMAIGIGGLLLLKSEELKKWR